MRSNNESPLTYSNVWGPGFQLQLNTLLSQIGPYIAIGRPGENLAGIGAARMYVADADWQEVILGYFRRAKLIIMRAGKTAGLRWELEQLHSLGKPESLLLILPHTEEDYAAFCTWANQVLPYPLPADKPAARFLTFQADWAPRILGWKRFLFDTLEPYFNQNGIRRQNIGLLYFVQYDSWLNYAVGSGVLVAAGLLLMTLCG